MGHLIPMLELAKRFVSHLSFKVTVFVVATDHSSIQHSQLLHNSPLAGSDDDDDDLLDIVLLPLVDVSKLVEPPDASVAIKLMMIMVDSLPFLRSEISNMESPPTALIVDMFGTVTLLTPGIDRAEMVEHAKNQKPLNIPGCEPLKFEDTILYERYCVDVAVKMSLTDAILMNSWDKLEPRNVKALRDAKKAPVDPIGTLVRPIEKRVLGNQVMDWLDKQPKESVIYVSFGRGGTLSGQQLI
ncbi:hypothetical protein PTKIN_Ptkin07bG0287100 [Pterospermum kingtungense]